MNNLLIGGGEGCDGDCDCGFTGGGEGGGCCGLIGGGGCGSC